MNRIDIAKLRLHNQRLAFSNLKSPVEVVEWLGAVQSQDYPGAKWALAMRSEPTTDAALDRLCNDGKILRTHVMRPTWHFVSPSDIRWLLALTAPRVLAVSASYFRKFELDDALFARSHTILTQALEGGKHLTRQELRDELQRGGIGFGSSDEPLRLSYIMMRAELDGVICSGPRRGKQFTYALLYERAPQAKDLPREEALAQLTQRYFTSHGPAMLKDFVWWSGLSPVDARAGVAIVGSQLISETIDGKTYWFSPNLSYPATNSSVAYLLPNYDEYIIGYTDRSAIFDPSYTEMLELVFPHSIVVDTQVVGAWKRIFKKDKALVETMYFTSLTTTQQEALTQAASKYGEYLDMPVILS